MIPDLYKKSQKYLEILCRDISERCVGSEGNREATYFFQQEINTLGWETALPEFNAIDWENEGAILEGNGVSLSVNVSPYSLSFEGTAELIAASDIRELESLNMKDKIVLLHGEIAKEQLMPKNFVFYNPPEHQKIIQLLEDGGPKAIICSTGRNAALAGGVYPFPLIEDGDFDIPSVYMTEEDGEKLIPLLGKEIFLKSRSERIPGKGFNVIGTKGTSNSKRIVITAHIDAKKGSPGAIDNATGVVILLLLADLLQDYKRNRLIEIIAFNGEDYYSVPGQMNYILSNEKNFNDILLNINIDGAGYKEGPSAFSFFNLPDQILIQVQEILNQFSGITEGVQWIQGDHSIFVQYGIPAIAVSSKWFTDNINDQDITHTNKDNMDIVDIHKLVEIAKALNTLIRNI